MVGDVSGSSPGNYWAYTHSGQWVQASAGFAHPDYPKLKGLSSQGRWVDLKTLSRHKKRDGEFLAANDRVI